MNAFDLLWLVPVLPFASSITLIVLPRLPRVAQAVLGVGSVSLAAVIALWIAWTFHQQIPAGGHYATVLWQWINVGGFQPDIALYVDALSLTLMLVITCVGALIHLFSAEYMAKDHRVDQGYGRYFAYLNMFVCAMLLLVLGDNLLLLYLGWEGVGICSYLLIGFWYDDAENGLAARKSFVVTRVGDTAMVVGLFILFTQLGTLNIQDLLLALPQQWQAGEPLALIAALLLLAGACGKSAQLPLHTWLPDAMAGPTPVSALIHAATMVTAGVYLIARMHPLFEFAPDALHAVAWVGAGTILLSGFTALGQYDIKRVLAWSTVSQIGYMFFALGVGAWWAAIFHLVTHAFFKALLFLSAGAAINSLHHEQDMRNMGGLWKLLPKTTIAFVVGGCTLMALPWVTAGFYSKEAILAGAWQSSWQPHMLWFCGALGAMLTGIYTTRLLLGMFAGNYRGKLKVVEKDGLPVVLPLAVLAVLSIVGGVLQPDLSGILPLSAEGHPPFIIAWLPVLLTFLGIFLAWLGWKGKLRAPAWAQRICANAFGFDALYDLMFVRPYTCIAKLNRNDIVAAGVGLLGRLGLGSHYLLALSENGRLRWYAVVMVGGMIALLTLVLAGVSP